MANTFPHILRLLLFVIVFGRTGASSYAQNVKFRVYDTGEQLESRIANAGDTTLVINFWATWCKPCVEELPLFDQLSAQYSSDKKLKVVLVSLDFKSQLEKKFIPFLLNQRPKSEVVLLADQDVNAWIPRISENWDGAIPATLVVKGKHQRFSQGKFKDYAELEAFVLPFFNGDPSLLTNKSSFQSFGSDR